MKLKILKKNKSISIDESKKFQDEIQKITDNSIKELKI